MFLLKKHVFLCILWLAPKALAPLKNTIFCRKALIFCTYDMVEKPPRARVMKNSVFCVPACKNGPNVRVKKIEKDKKLRG